MTFVTWDFGHCSRWDKSGHLGISRDVKGHLRPGTLGIVLGRTSRDILGYSEALHYIFVYLGQLGKSVAVLELDFTLCVLD